MKSTVLTDDEIVILADTWAKSTKLRIYKHLFNSGCTMNGIDAEISKALKEEKADG